MSDPGHEGEELQADSEPVPRRPDLAARDAKLSAFLDQQPDFESVRPLIEPPLEITRSMLSLLNMRDETVIVYEDRGPRRDGMPRQRAPQDGSSL